LEAVREGVVMGNALMRAGTTLHASLIKSTGKFGGGGDDGSLLVLSHRGAMSGRVRHTPLSFLNVDNGYVVVASMGGAPQHPGWYHNLKANPDTVVNVAGVDVAVRARETSHEERDRLWERLTSRDRRWANYQSKTSRTLPVLVLERR
jgi:deazaflavin-dependent oxidoreductase (nitroreductase family)